jgi:hypothetical protein
LYLVFVNVFSFSYNAQAYIITEVHNTINMNVINWLSRNLIYGKSSFLARLWIIIFFDRFLSFTRIEISFRVFFFFDCFSTTSHRPEAAFFGPVINVFLSFYYVYGFDNGTKKREIWEQKVSEKSKFIAAFDRWISSHISRDIFVQTFPQSSPMIFSWKRERAALINSLNFSEFFFVWVFLVCLPLPFTSPLLAITRAPFRSVSFETLNQQHVQQTKKL